MIQITAGPIPNTRTRRAGDLPELMTGYSCRFRLCALGHSWRHALRTIVRGVAPKQSSIDHDLEGRSAAGSFSGAKSRIHFGTNTAQEKADAYLHHFFRVIDKEINHLFGRERLPIVLVAVDREIAMYRKASNYPCLLESSLCGSPEHLTDQELYRRALDALEVQEAVDEDRLLSQFAESESRGLALTDESAVIEAARRGQIYHLILSDRESTTSDDAIMNSIALETIRDHGIVSTVAHHELLGNQRLAAILRYHLAGPDKGSR